MARIRLVTFDVLHTLITPRKAIHLQYADVFKPHLGSLEPEAIKGAFRTALREVQKELPAYQHGAPAWWSEVIQRTALGAGADRERLQLAMKEIVPDLLKRFSSRLGYVAFEDAIPTVARLHEAGFHVGIISNGDSRFRMVLEDLGFPNYIEPIALSAEIGVEKPDRALFGWTVGQYNSMRGEENVGPESCLHIGDELECDYHGARQAGFQSRLLRREGAHELKNVEVIEGLGEVLKVVKMPECRR